MSRNADAVQMQMQSRCIMQNALQNALQNVLQNALQMQIALQSLQIRKHSGAISNGLRARSAGPDLRATPTAAYPCVYATGSEVCEKLECLENAWRVYEGSGEARGAL